VDAVALGQARRKPSAAKGRRRKPWPAKTGPVEAVLVEGRRPGSCEALAFDEAAAEEEPGGIPWVRRKVWLVRMVATEDVRGYATSLVRVENACTRRACAEEPRSKLHQDRAGSSLVWHQGWAPLPARGVVAKPKLEHRRQARLYLMRLFGVPRGSPGGVLRNRTVQRVLVG